MWALHKPVDCSNKGYYTLINSQTPPWKLEPPILGEARIKEKDSETYHWCPKHKQAQGMWVILNPTDCKVKKQNNKDRKQSLEQNAMPTIADNLKITDQDEDH
jgi:hypothetical protein